MQALPYERPRPGQLEAVKWVVGGIEKGVRKLVLQAFTGFGKTAVAIASCLECLQKGLVDRAVVCVRTRNELDPVMRELRRFGVDDFVVLFSARTMCPLASSEDIDPSSFWIVCAALRYGGRCPYYRRVRSELGSARERISQCESYVEIPRRLADELGVCPFFTSLALIESSRFVVCTYPYVFRERIWSSTLREALEGKKTLLVVDEAHNMLNFGSLVGEEVGVEAIERSVAEGEKLGVSNTILRTLRFIVSKARAVGRARGRGWVWIEGVPRPEPSEVSRVRELLIELKMRASLAPEEAMRFASPLTKALALIELLSKSDFEIYYSPESECVAAMPTNPRPLHDVLSRFSYVVAMSGTAYVKPLRKLVGEDSLYLDVEDLGAQSFLRTNVAWCVAAFLTSRFKMRSEAMFDRYADVVRLCRSVVKGCVKLFVYPSYEFMRNVLLRLGAGGECVVVEDRKLTLEHVARRALGCGDCEIHAVAGGKVTEGVEIVRNGESLVKLVAIMGVPYPQPDDYLEHVAKFFESVGVGKYELLETMAVLRVVQSVGRAVRFDSDRAAVILADSRFLRPSIRRALRLERVFVARGLAELRRFLTDTYISLR